MKLEYEFTSKAVISFSINIGSLLNLVAPLLSVEVTSLEFQKEVSLTNVVEDEHSSTVSL